LAYLESLQDPGAAIRDLVAEVRRLRAEGAPVGTDRLRCRIAALREAHRPFEGRDQTDAFIEAVLALQDIRLGWASDTIERLRKELDAAQRENRRLRNVGGGGG
jgi:hypothetical protein